MENATKCRKKDPDNCFFFTGLNGNTRWHIREKYGTITSSYEKRRIAMVRKAEIKKVEGLRGGVGRLEMHHILKPEELNGHGRMYAMVKMEPHSTIGFHEHIGETEPYYVVSGHGTFIDNEKNRIPVGPDDVCLIECGQSHGFENNSDEELILMALVYNE